MPFGRRFFRMCITPDRSSSDERCHLHMAVSPTQRRRSPRLPLPVSTCFELIRGLPSTPFPRTSMTNPAEPVIGALLIELCFAFILYGLTTLQTFIYFQKYPNDTCTLKYLVGAVWLLESAHTGFCMQFLYAYFVAGFGNYAYLRHVNWGVGATAACSVGVALCVQGYYTWRIWIVSGNNKVWTAAIGAFAMIRIGLGIGSFAQSYIYPQWILLRNAKSAYATFSGGLGAAALVDMLVAVGLSLYLTRNRNSWNRESESMVNRILLYAVNTGAITGVTSLLCVVLFAVPNTGLAFLGLTMIQTKLYANSLLGSLNARAHIRNKGSSHPGRYSSSSRSGGTSGLRVTSPRMPVIEIFQQTTTAHDDGSRGFPRGVSGKDEYPLQAMKGGELA
ncbi:hypothetical protein BD413DRAFT_253167 [Trametes elegans]|nr:hypothetical protein BD413DRAFT_253167 [Trametes elegans]